jgi:energy-coupling factor transport system ATP-binding protein
VTAGELRSFITVRDLEYAYRLDGGGQVAALRGLDLDIGQGEFVALIGPNGSGKSTLAYHLNALLLPTSGQVWVDGLLTSDPAHTWDVRQRVGMVFQNPDNQLVAGTVEEDVAFGPENNALPTAEIRRRVDEALAIVGLTGHAAHPPQLLSGGQKQLTAIAGALATRPACMVLDEPTSMLDPQSRRQVSTTIRRLNEREGMTIVLITQSMQEAAAARRVIAMHAGRIVIDGPPQDVFERREQLCAIGLDLPPVVEIAHRLRDLGMTLPHGLLTVEALARAVGHTTKHGPLSTC